MRGGGNQSHLHSGSPRHAESFDPSPGRARVPVRQLNLQNNKKESDVRVVLQNKKTWYLIRSALAVYICNEKLSMTRISKRKKFEPQTPAL
jgi:hypothetical protein